MTDSFDLFFQALEEIDNENYDEGIRILNTIISGYPDPIEAKNKPTVIGLLKHRCNALFLNDNFNGTLIDLQRLKHLGYCVDDDEVLRAFSIESRIRCCLGDASEELKICSKKFDNKRTPGVITKDAVAMYSKESEKVDFPNKMREIVRYCLAEAMNAYEEKSHELWVQHYPAQIVLTGLQVFWTIEVNLAFSRIEEGYENGLKDYFKKVVGQLNTLIELLLTDIQSRNIPLVESK